MQILVTMLTAVLEKLPDDVVKKALDRLLDVIEDAIEKSENKIDDALVLPALQFIREQLGIPDND